MIFLGFKRIINLSFFTNGDMQADVYDIGFVVNNQISRETDDKGEGFFGICEGNIVDFDPPKKCFYFDWKNSLSTLHKGTVIY